ncbi:MAG: energy-coupling factor transporter ATPase [Chloroflexi bacterium]|nr:energy-coupling factor transporter ATPase [Chloroflexota bacterium]
MSAPIVQLSHLSYTYLAGTELAATALVDASLSVSEGEIVALVGPSGAGKSTLVSFVNGLLRPEEGGRAVILGLDTHDPAADLSALRSQVGLVMQHPHQQLFERYVGDDIAYGPRQMGLSGESLRGRVRWAMEAVGLDFETFVDRRTFALSGGEMRRAALAGVLAMQPRILVLDEATAGLDQVGRSQVHEVLHRLQSEQGLTIVLVTNEMDEVVDMADSVSVLVKGHTVASGAVREVLGDASLMERCGLTVPEATELAQDLREHGIPIGQSLLSDGEVEEALWHVLHR